VVPGSDCGACCGASGPVTSSPPRDAVLTARPSLPFGGLLLAGLGLLAVTFWPAGTRWGNDNGRGGVFAGPAVVVLLIVTVRRWTSG
jgi:hypothetical protein